MTVFLHEFKYGINSYLRDDVHRNPETKSAGGRQILSLADIIEFNKEDGSTKMFNQNILEASQATDGLGNRTYKAKKEQNIRASRKYLDFLLDAYDLDALVGPVEEKMNTSMIFSMAAISGYPSFTIPVGVNKDGVPFGMTFVGTLFSDKTLVRIGGLTKSHRSPPKFLQ
jgi:amidase